MKKIIPYGKQDITQADIDAVTEVLRSDYLTQGPRIEEFENEFAAYVGSSYAVAVSNGTAALHLSVMALGLKPGDKVITTPITFAASANCVRYSGAEVVFADIDPDTYLLDINSVKKLLQSAPKGTYKGVIPVDFAGRAVDLEGLRELANEYDLWIIEDACHAPGASFIDSKEEKQLCGNGKFADLTVFSFHPVKHIACGEGGMITTNNAKLFESLMKLRTHGITKNEPDFVNDVGLASGITEGGKGYPGWYMEMHELGYNYRLTDMQCALGLSQLRRAKTGVARRREIAKVYSEAFDDKDFVLGHSKYSKHHAYHLYVIEVNNRLGLYNYLRERGVFAQIHYFPCHLMPYYQGLGYKEGDYPISEKYYERCISLPMYPTLSEEDQEFVINSIIEYFE
ncbi:UDP-4-amino-4,6-dideoxy-N-acetyl-beta-L-altrosamine transaminase [Robertkochia marina]|uniref:UDP-4-amino-4, 6-dideoxy-N-acetyl-beta-L-altrosamine transaminase n=1 Tax=Robertkochia marina TaxID=1227945 RepID=A0A4S3M135_9FLAO|nr:UDP-4-amino-4,6-dideoxy-N-acetyl-beta-L-altrosamine transaminase [Robertkochia marina]THD67723.1 UDP-4-amino-4,6-dideoxy-N-acetyl-beta-L-altrosamine transaminase [Robertkochia marina]TRZ43454.1 UDP-4-amino-4,6-dideoxy-N-acetyl-beta-L-altrosamine transaminase [Robertkochia marina]